MSNEKMYLEIINNIIDGVYFVDRERRITFWNKAAEEITGYRQEEIIGQRCQEDLLKHIDKDGKPLCTTGCPLYTTLIDGQQRKGEVFLRHKDGYRIPILINTFPMMDEDRIIGAIEIFTSRSPIVYDDDLIKRLSDLAMNDPLTGLANRRKMESYLEYNLHEMKHFQHTFCIVFLDIDNFSKFNNTFGHETGDIILNSIAKSIMHTVRKDDLFGRWGGEEFIGIFRIKNGDEATIIAEKIRLLIEKTEIPYENRKISVTASLGVTVAHFDDSIDSIIRRADMLMYQSKKNGKNRINADI
jgi:diguanylate cyclase (GGDEF)-like protein/PAS domain S-box-containing protein